MRRPQTAPFGFWILDFGFRILDFGFWILDFGFRILDFGFWILDFGFRILDFGFWILDFGLGLGSIDTVWILHKIFASHADSGRRIMLRVCDGYIYPQFFNSGSLRWLKFDHFGYMSISGSCTNLQDPTHCMIWFLVTSDPKLVSLSTYPFVNFRFRSSCQQRWSERNGTTLCQAPGWYGGGSIAWCHQLEAWLLHRCIESGWFHLGVLGVGRSADFFWDGKTNITLMEYISFLKFILWGKSSHQNGSWGNWACLPTLASAFGRCAKTCRALTKVGGRSFT